MPKLKLKVSKKEKKKEKEGDEKGEKGEKGEKKEEDNLKIIQYTPNENEIKLKQYNDLKDYFISLLPKEQKEQITIDVTGKSNYDVSKDIKAGKLKKIEKKLDDEFGAETAAGKKGKKGKKPKLPKDSRKTTKKVGLTLDFEMIQKITDAGLSAPTKVEDIPKFLEELDKKKSKFDKGEKSKKDESKTKESKEEENIIIEIKEEETKEEEPKKVEHKKEPRKEQRKEKKNN